MIGIPLSAPTSDVSTGFTPLQLG